MIRIDAGSIPAHRPLAQAIELNCLLSSAGMETGECLATTTDFAGGAAFDAGPDQQDGCNAMTRLRAAA
jgi:hypothetical protein